MAITLNGTTNVITPTTAVQPTGSILQVVSTTKTDTFSESVNSGSFSAVVTGLTAVITPSATSSKILIQYAVAVSKNGIYMVLDRGGSTLTASTGAAASNRTRLTMAIQPSDNDYMTNLAGHFVDSPSSTSALTYGIKLRHSSGSAQSIYVNRSHNDTDDAVIGRGASVITVMEIAG